jgi:hypothetical protein
LLEGSVPVLEIAPGVVALTVELGVALGGWLSDVESVFIVGARIDGFEVVLGAVLVVGFVPGADLFLLWSPKANADPLASATIDVMTNIGASLRI